jgi:hypothetical protein
MTRSFGGMLRQPSINRVSKTIAPDSSGAIPDPTRTKREYFVALASVLCPSLSSCSRRKGARSNTWFKDARPNLLCSKLRDRIAGGILAASPTGKLTLFTEFVTDMARRFLANSPANR